MNRICLSDHFTYRKLLRFCLSPVCMMVFTSVYGVVDGLFVSNFVGKTPFAAINLIMPFIMILGGMGFMIGAGGSALVAQTLGRGDRENANRYFSLLVKFCLYFGLVLSVAGFFCMPAVARLLGATDNMMADCVLYGRTVICFIAAFMLQNVFQTFLTTAEKPKLGFYFTLAAGCANMVLDALFVAVLDLGVFGAALATGVSQCVGALVPFVYFLRPNGSLLRLTRTPLSRTVILRSCANGSSELVNNISMSVVGMVYNFQLLAYVGENGVAAYGVLMYIQFIFVAIFIGYSIGSAPLIGYHYGAGNKEELRNLFRKSLAVMIFLGVSMCASAEALAGTLARIFVGYDAELCALTVHAFRLFSFAFLLFGINIFASSLFTALGDGKISAVVSFLRTMGMQLGSVLLLPLLFGIDGIWWSVSVAEACAFLVSGTFLLTQKKKYGYMA